MIDGVQVPESYRRASQHIPACVLAFFFAIGIIGGMAKWTSKPWGKTRPLIREEFLHADEIEVAAGGYCSIHRHMAKANVFHVQDGVLVVRQFSALNAPAYERTVCAGQSRAVEAGIWHQFWCMGKCRAIEVYLPPRFNDPLIELDIDRHPACNVGGIVDYAYRLDEMWAKAFGAVLAGTR